MTRVFVTVGTTPFDALIEAADGLNLAAVSLCLQIGDGTYTPSSYPWIRYTNNIDQLYKSADLVVSHAGAGTVYRLMELRKPTVLVPNLDRDDHHQLDLYEYMVSNRYAFGVSDPKKLAEAIVDAEENLDKLKIYQHEKFSAVDELLEILAL